MTQMNKESFEKTIDWYIDFLHEKCPPLYRRHKIEEILKDSVNLYYPDELTAEEMGHVPSTFKVICNKCKGATFHLVGSQETRPCLECNQVGFIWKPLKKVGDVVKYKFADNDSLNVKLAGQTFEVEVAAINHEEKCYCVYAPYGQDQVPFDQVLNQKTPTN